jgi:hypothetical protein
MTNKHRILAGLAIIMVAGLFLFWPAKTPEVVAKSRPAEYPALWTEMGLPRIPGGKVIRCGHRRSAENGIRFEIGIRQRVSQVGSYFEKQLGQRDFEFYSGRSWDDTEYDREFRSRDTDISINAQPDPGDPGASRVNIVIRKQPPRSTPLQQASLRVD